jgi:DNA-binding transcriptional MerR regulator
VKNLISIGKFSALSELSVRTLRLYDELEVLKPAFTDPDTNYRRYSLDQVSLAHQIRVLRQLEIPLPKIRHIIADPVQTNQRLSLHRHDVLRKLENLKSQINLLDRMIRTQAGVNTHAA